ATCHRRHVTISDVQDLYTTSMTVDPAGNLYLAWIAGGSRSNRSSDRSAGPGPNPKTEAILGSGVPVLSVSRNHGRTWSAPTKVGPPGIRDAEMIAITARHTGEIAISYLASRSGSPLLDGWLSETRE